MRMKRVLVFLFLFSVFPEVWAIPIDQVPNPRATTESYVQDSGLVLSLGYADLINAISFSLKRDTTAELAVVTVDNLEGYEVKDYAQKLAELWGVGQENTNNGLILLLSRDDRKIAIQVGYGLEGVITDATSGRLLDTLALPHLKEGKTGRALYELTKGVAKTIATSKIAELGMVDSSGKAVTWEFPDPPVWPEEAVPPVEVPENPLGSQKKLPMKWWFLVSFVGSLLLIFLNLGITALRVFFPKARAAKRRVFQNKRNIFAILLGCFSFFVVFPLLLISTSAILIGLACFSLYGAFLYGCMHLRGLLHSKWKKGIERYQLSCPKCSKKMTLLGEEEDDKYLNEGEIAEELAKGMDYEFWRCTPCDYLHRLNVPLGLWGHKCPNCSKKSLKTSSKTTQAATAIQSGLMLVTYECLNPSCHYKKDETRIIPHISQSSGVSGGGWRGGSGGASFGGGNFGGGGASRGW